MTDFAYRYSIIPGGAVTDPRLEPRDLQVLALLGRHTKHGGWCWRSQVKMAKELGCGRATVQRSLNRLCDAEWVERRLRGRGSAEPNAEKQPFASHWYRVRLDNTVPDEMLARLESAAEPDDQGQEGCPSMGTPTGGHPGAHLDGHGGAHLSGHHEGTLSEGTPIEDSERDAHAREDKRLPVRRFLLKWPTAAVDDKAKITKAWDALPEDQLEAALDGIDPFLAELKKHGRKHIPAGWKYLEDQSWKLIDKPPEVPKNQAFDCWSKEWWATLISKLRAGQNVAFFVKYAIDKSHGQWGIDPPPPPEAIADFRGYPSDGPEMQAWRSWFESKGVKLPQWRERIWVFLPATGPPPS